jgi:hypothetical protein
MLTSRIPLQLSGEIKYAHRKMVEKSLKMTHFSRISHLGNKKNSRNLKVLLEGRTHPKTLKDASVHLVYSKNM